MSSRMSVTEILKLLGTPSVLIPLRKNSKAPIEKGWPSMTAEMMRQKSYLDKLNAAENIGVSLGVPSGGLVTIDIDAEEELRKLERLNPLLKRALLTSRVRGGNVWVRLMDSRYPATVKLKRKSGGSYGEFRSTGGQTAIAGSAIDKKKGETVPTAYRVIRPGGPASCYLSEIRFPHGFSVGGVMETHEERAWCASRHSSESWSLSAESLRSEALSPKPLYDIDKMKKSGRAIEAERIEAERFSAEHPKLAKFYEHLIASRFLAAPHERNSFLVNVIPFLFHVVAPEIALELVIHFYRSHKNLFNDSEAEHRCEADALLSGVERTYWEGLEGQEREILAKLESRDQTAFRILRDLAIRAGGCFFMSAGQLAMRLGVDVKTGDRILKKFSAFEIIKILKKGKQWCGGKRPEATSYVWQVPLPIIPTDNQSGRH